MKCLYDFYHFRQQEQQNKILELSKEVTKKTIELKNFKLTKNAQVIIGKQLKKLDTKVGKAIAEIDRIQGLWKKVSSRINAMEDAATASSKSTNEAGKEYLFKGLSDMFREWYHMKDVLKEFCDVFACEYVNLDKLKEEEDKQIEEESNEVLLEVLKVV